jgi:hypothetical protein
MWQEWRVPVFRVLLPIAIALTVLIGGVWLLSLFLGGALLYA